MPITLNLFGTLHLGRQGMAAQQAGLNVVGQNVANANTDGYNRRLVSLSSRPGPPFGGGGVAIDGIKRYTDQFAETRLVEEQTLYGYSDQRSSILGHVSELVNDLEDSGLGSSLDAFFGAVRLLESSPNDTTVRQEVIARGHELASGFNRIANEIAGVQGNVDNVLKASAGDVNLRVAEIAQLNKEISYNIAMGEDSSDLLDHRTRLIREVAEHVDVSFTENSKGEITLFMEGGRPLVEAQTYSTLEVTNAAPGTAQVLYVSPNGTTQNITGIIKGGAMGGALDVRDTVIPMMSTELDNLAFDMVTAVNATHQAGFGLDGVGGRDFFTALGAAAGAAGLISVDAGIMNNPDAVAAATDPAMLPGDNRNALNLAALADQPLASGGTLTFNEAYATLVGNIGVTTRRSVDEAAMRQTAIKHVEQIRDSQAGVSIDEELTYLTQYQRGYQASSRFLSVIDQIIQDVLRLV